jgi:peptidoglycan hydrolase-like protein with peptidoglycan-binding domain
MKREPANTTSAPLRSNATARRKQSLAQQREPAHVPQANHQMQSLLRSGALQARLSVSQPGDPLERQADAMAERVMGGASAVTPSNAALAPAAQAPPVQRRCAACDEEAQRKEAGGTAGPASHAAGAEVTPIPGAGVPLPSDVRSYFEPRFGSDFSRVRVHTGDRADHAARALNAHAYTMRNDIVFAEGRYSPNTADGRRLLAHELTHTVQQQPGGAERIQRTIGDGHDLTAPRFSGNAVLEAVYDNERVLRNGHRGTAVRLLQQALLDSGMELPRFGVDGIFGAETEAAVKDFQHASGLTGADIDGIVGPTTMGWLDQAFSAGPTPAGTSPGATTGCTTIKTVNVDVVSMDGSTRNGIDELERANTIFNQCCVHFNLSGGGSLDGPSTAALMGGDNILTKSTACGSSTAEERSLVSGVRSALGLGGRILVIFVNDTSPSVPAYSFPPFCATGGAAAMSEVSFVTNAASIRGMAHELGHQLLNNGNHPTDPLNLMSAPGSPPGEQLNAADCATIFSNA